MHISYSPIIIYNVHYNALCLNSFDEPFSALFNKLLLQTLTEENITRYNKCETNNNNGDMNQMLQ